MPGPGRPPGRCTVVNTVVYQFKYTSANLNIPILVSPGQSHEEARRGSLGNSSLQLTVQGSGMAEICPKFASRFRSKFALCDPQGLRFAPRSGAFRKARDLGVNKFTPGDPQESKKVCLGANKFALEQTNLPLWSKLIHPGNQTCLPKKICPLRDP